VFPICKGDPNELWCVHNVSLKGVGKCKRLAQSQAMLDSVFLSAADVVLLTADEQTSMKRGTKSVFALFER
jgi:hypothetical protein